MICSEKKSHASKTWKNAFLRFGGLFDIDRKREDIQEMEAQIAAPDFWENGDTAQKVLKERTSLEKIVDAWDKLTGDLEDVKVLVELGSEAEDEETLAEVRLLNDRLDEGVCQAEFQKMLSGPHDKNACYVSITAGAGGTEAQDWAEMLLRMYLRYCEKRGWRTEITEYQAGDEAGIKGVTFTVDGEFSYGYLKAEAGIHRLVRVSPFDGNARRHTSFASVYVFPEIDDDIEVIINDADLRIDTYRSGGAGGQHVNVTDSAVRITHIPTGIVAACQNERSQHMNKATAMRVLRAKLYERELEERAAKASEIGGEKKDIGWGSQIRSYVLHPYRMVKDLRTGVETGNTDAVLNGDLDEFIIAFLMGVRRNDQEGAS